MAEMLAQRVYGLALGYEDLNDNEQLRQDPLLAVLAGKREPSDRLAGKSTLNRLELTPEASPAASHRYHKITYSSEQLDALLVDIFLEAHRAAPAEKCGLARRWPHEKCQRKAVQINPGRYIITSPILVRTPKLDCRIYGGPWLQQALLVCLSMASRPLMHFRKP